MTRALPEVFGGRRRRLFAGLVAVGAGQALAAVATVLLVRTAFDRLPAGAAAAVLWPALGLAATALAVAWLRYAERAGAERLGQDYVTDVRLVLFDRLSSLAPRALQRRSRGGVMLRFVGDLTALRQWVSLGLARLTVAGISACGALAALAAINPLLGGVVTTVLCIGMAAALGLGARMRRAAREARRLRTRLAANVSEKIATMPVVQVFGQARRERRHLARQSSRLGAAEVRRARVAGGLRAVTEGTAVLAVAAALLAGAFGAAAGQATAGTVVAAVAIVGFLVAPLRDLGRVYEYWQGARVAREKIRQFLDTPALVDEADDAVRLRAGPGRLRFDRVRVRGALRRVSLEAEPGTVTAIVGPNGAGKSTLLALAARLIDPDGGRVRLDGRDLARVRLSSLRREVGMVSPDLPLLRGTIDRNLRYRCPDAPQAEIERVTALCGLDTLLEELPEGAATRLAEGGANLSPGQRQRIALARAIVGQPRLLLLDEAESNLDPRSALALDRVLSGYRGTVLMVTHRPDRLAAADRIWHLEDGRLVEAGAAQALAHGEGPTARLFGADWVHRSVS